MSNYFQNEFLKKRGFLIKTLILIFLIVLLCFLVLNISAYGFDPLNYSFFDQLITIFIGASAIGIATYLLQEMVNNKLADTSIMGIGNINLIVAVVIILLMKNKLDDSLANIDDTFTLWFVFSSIIMSILLYFLSTKKSVFSSKKMIIIGIILNVSLIAFYEPFSNLIGQNKKGLIDIYSIGGIFILSNFQKIIGIIILFISTIWIMFLKKKMFITNSNLLIAKNLGINTDCVNFQVVIIVGILTGVSFFSLGNLMLLGLVSASLSRLTFKKNYNYSIFGSSLFSILLLIISFFINNLLTDINPKLSGIAINIFPIIAAPYFVTYIIKTKKY